MLLRADSSERVLESEGAKSNGSTAQKSGKANQALFSLKNQESEDQDDTFESSAIYNSKVNKMANQLQLMPHDKNAINFLINEYLLEQNYKMTSVTFSEENESLDLEDWDVIGLNRSKPPSLRQLYKFYLNRKNSTNTVVPSKSVESDAPLVKASLEDSSCQTEKDETKESSSNTDLVKMVDSNVMVNFDKDTYENQRMQINKLLEKQDLLLKSISKLESEIDSLNSDKEYNLKKIDSL